MVRRGHKIMLNFHSNSKVHRKTTSHHNTQVGGPRGRVVKVADFIIALDYSIISPLWLVWVRAPHGSQVRQVKFYLRVCQVVFPGVLPFSPHLLIGSSRYEWNNLERDVKLNKKKPEDQWSCETLTWYLGLAQNKIWFKMAQSFLRKASFNFQV